MNQPPHHYAYKMLARKDLSTEVFRTKMQKYTDEETVEKIIKEFLEKNFLNDRRYIQSFIQDQVIKKNGPLKIWFKIKEKKVNKSIFDEVLEEIYPETEQKRIVYLLSKKKKDEIEFKDISEPEKKKKLQNYLFNKGFSYDLISKIED